MSLLFACAQPVAMPSVRTTDPVPMIENAADRPAVGPATAVLAAYERARSLLAADTIDGLAIVARDIEAAAKSAGYADIAQTAAHLAAQTSLEVARTKFGDLSRHLVALLAKDPSLARGQHVFECPMVTGYAKWIQPTEDLQNPYMGKRMLACGGESTWQ
jgi:Cu(I)/Ag(I) efflux system membrane fusion protein